MINDVNRELPSKMAEMMAMHRVIEAVKPEEERICYDQYAIHFISQETLDLLKKLTNDPALAKIKIEESESLFPGIRSSIVARVRYFDDFVEKSSGNGLEQLVILGAGYDTRAYRIEGLKRNVKIFEVDHPNTQSFKIQKLEQIFGSVPEHVVYVPVDFENETLSQRLFDSGYDSSKKTLFIMEGLTMYIPPEAVDETLSFIVENSGKGSQIIFDYYPESIVDGSSELEISENLRKYTSDVGEPLQFGIEEGKVEEFLSKRGFSNIQNVTSEDYKKEYFHGVNENRNVSSILYFVHAVIG